MAFLSEIVDYYSIVRKARQLILTFDVIQNKYYVGI